MHTLRFDAPVADAVFHPRTSKIVLVTLACNEVVLVDLRCKKRGSLAGEASGAGAGEGSAGGSGMAKGKGKGREVLRDVMEGEDEGAMEVDEAAAGYVDCLLQRALLAFEGWDPACIG